MENAENTIPSNLERNADRNKRRRLSRALKRYFQQITELNLVDRLILATDEQNSQAFIFNVLRENFSAQTAANPKSVELTKVGGQLQEKLEPIIAINVLYVDPSDLLGLRVECKQRGVLIDEVELVVPNNSAVITF